MTAFDGRMDVKRAIEIVKPKVLVFVGICASMKPKKAKLGDVIVSKKVAYKDKIIGGDYPVFRKVGPLILSAADGWKPPLKDPSSLKVKVHRDAVILSNSKYDNARQKMVEHFPEALGLDTEATGIEKIR